MTEFADGSTLAPLSAISLNAAAFFALLLMFTRFGRNAYHRIEQILSKFAETRVLPAAVLFFSIIAIRLALLPILPVPIPKIHDEFVYLMQADTFMHGRLANPPHPMWLSFETFHVNWFPTYSSMFPPAQGFVLALGQWIGSPWLGVLLSDAAMCVAILWMLQGFMPARWALLGAIMATLKFGFTSYWMNSFWGGAVAGIGGAVVLGAIARIAKKANARDALLLGFGIAILANSRLYEGFFFCLPAAVWLILWLTGRIKTKHPASVRGHHVFLPLGVALILTGAWLGYYNWRLTGNPLLLPHILNTRTYHTMPLFLWQHAKPKLHYRNVQFQVFYNGIERENYRTTWTDVKKVCKEKVEIFETNYFWPGAQFALLGVPFLFRDRKMRLLLLTLALTAVAIFSVTWSMPHYTSPLACVVYALTAQAIRHLRTMRYFTMPFGIALSRAILVLLILNTATLASSGQCDPDSWRCEGDPGRAAIAETLMHLDGKHLVIVHYPELHNPHREWVFNGADLDGAKILWARDMGPEQDAVLVRYYKDRRIWFVNMGQDEPELVPFSSSVEQNKVLALSPHR